MALNIRPFLGPTPPDWTDPPTALQLSVSVEDESEKSDCRKPDELDEELKSAIGAEVKKLDII